MRHERPHNTVRHAPGLWERHNRRTRRSQVFARVLWNAGEITATDKSWPEKAPRWG